MRLTPIVHLLALIAVCVADCYSQTPANMPPVPGLGSLPMAFEANRGQAPRETKFVAHGKGYTALLTSSGLTLSLRPSSIEPVGHAPAQARSLTSSPVTVVQLSLLGATSSPEVVGEDALPGRVNYFIGNDPRRWRTNIPTFARIRQRNVYPGIDLVYYGSNRELEYDFELAPGADPQNVRFEVKGARQVTVNANGDLVLTTKCGTLSFQTPVIYQVSAGQRVKVEGNYVLRDANHVGFHVASYDRGQALVIDPVLLYSTYLGGSGDDTPRSVAVDASGNVYIAGYSDSSNFPLATLGSLASATPHVFVSKLDSTASNLVYTDYIGGNSQDFGYALALDSAHNVYVTGSTASSDFPVVNAFQPTYPGAFNAFLTKISSNGASLLYSSYLGGNGSDVPSGIALDGVGNIVVSGYTSSTNFPVVNAFQSTVSPNQGGMYGNYGFVTKFVPSGASLAYSTYFGGSANVAFDCGFPCWPQPSSTITGLVVDSSGNAYVAGTTNTYDFPTTTGAYLTSDTTQLNGTVGFVSKLSGTGGLQYSTYFYESSGLLTNINALAIDSSGSAYVTGIAISDGTFPVTSTSICDPGVYNWACSYGFVTKFDPSGSNLAYSTFLGPNNFVNPVAISVDPSNDAYVLGTTSSSSFNTINGLESYAGGNDLLLMKIDAAATSELWATYVGGTLDDNAAAMAIDSSGDIYVVGSTNSLDFPTMSGAFQGIQGGNSDVFAVKISQVSAPAVSLTPKSLQFALQQAGTSSQAQTILLRNMGSSALTISSTSVSGDFSETGTCGNNVPAAGSCTLSVTFTPSVSGHRTGTITLIDDAIGSAHVVSLSGDASSGASITVNPTSVTFPDVALRRSSSAQAVTISSNGPGALNIISIQAAGDFTQTNNCLGFVAAGTTCTVNVTFTPVKSGNRTGNLNIVDDAASSPQTVPLAGTGADFSLASVPSTNTIKSGSTATYGLNISALGGSFGNPVQLSCSGLPSKATCNFSPNSVTPGGNQSMSTLTITTTASTAELSPGPRAKQTFFYAFCLQFPGLGLFGMIFGGPAKNRALKYRWLLLFALLASLVLMAACAGGTGIVNPGGNGTPAGTYTITVTGTSGSLQHAIPVTLTVQ